MSESSKGKHPWAPAEMSESVRQEYLPRDFRELYDLEVEKGHIETGSSRVFRGRYKRDGHEVAVKFFNFATDKKRNFLKEMDLAYKILVEVESPYVLHYEDVVYDEEMGLGLITPWMENGSLYGHDTYVGHPTLESGSSYAMQVALGLDALHQKGIVHRDLKPGNVFLTDDMSSGFHSCVITDFGQSVTMDYLAKTKTQQSGDPKSPHVNLSELWDNRDTNIESVFGTPEYVSPEQASNKTMDYRTDFFSLGIMLYEMFMRKHPFFGKDDTRESLMSNIVNSKHTRIVIPGATPDDFRNRLVDIVDSLLIKDPEKRGTLPDGRNMKTGRDIAREIADCWIGSGSPIVRTPWFSEALE